jgi:hypothetical protein
MDSFGDSIKDLPTNPAALPVAQGQLEYLDGIMNRIQLGARDPEPESVQDKPKSGFQNLKKAGILAFLYAMMSLGVLNRGMSYFVENGIARKVLLSFAFFILAFLVVRFF